MRRLLWTFGFLWAVVRRPIGLWWGVATSRFGVRRVLCVFSVLLVTSAVLVAVEGNVSEAAVECQSATSDPDGDGWGWENGETCSVSDSGPESPTVDENTGGQNTDNQDAGNQAADDQAADDQDVGIDENGSGATPTQNPPQHSGGPPDCSANESDPDGDGFGWENGATCKVLSGVKSAPNPTVQPTEVAPETTIGTGQIDEPEPEPAPAPTQAEIFRDRIFERLGEQKFRRFQDLIVELERLLTTASDSSGDRKRVEAALWAVEEELAPLTVCTEHTVALGVLLADEISLSYATNNGTNLGDDLAEQLWDLVNTLDSEGKIQVDQDACPAPQTANSYPDCTGSEDPDGDGFGWENNSSCRIVAQPTTPDQLPEVPGSDLNVVVADDSPENPGSVVDDQSNLDPASLMDELVAASETPLADANETQPSSVGDSGGTMAVEAPPNPGDYPVCLNDSSGGFGWEQNMSCLAVAAPRVVTSVCAIEQWAGAGFDFGRIANSWCSIQPESAQSNDITATDPVAPEPTPPTSVDPAQVATQPGGVDPSDVDSSGVQSSDFDSLIDPELVSPGPSGDVAATEPEPRQQANSEFTGGAIESPDVATTEVVSPELSDLAEEVTKVSAGSGDLPVCVEEQSGAIGFEQGMSCLALSYEPETPQTCVVDEWSAAGFTHGRVNGRWCTLAGQPALPNLGSVVDENLAASETPDEPQAKLDPTNPDSTVDATTAGESGVEDGLDAVPEQAATNNNLLGSEILQVGTAGDMPICLVAMSGETSVEQGMTCLPLTFSPTTTQPCTVPAWVGAGFEQGRQGGRWCNVVKAASPVESGQGIGVVQGLSVSYFSYAGWIEWDAPVNGSPTRYEVLRDGEYLATVVPGSTNRFLDKSFTTGRTHLYTVSAVDDSGERPIVGAPVTVPFFYDADQGFVHVDIHNQMLEGGSAGDPLTDEPVTTSSVVDDGFSTDAVRPVQGLTASQTAFVNEIVLSWTVSSEGPKPTEFEIVRDGQPVGSVDIPFYYDTDISPGRSYTYTVSPVVVEGTEIRSGLGLSVQTDPVVPIPQSITAGAATGLTVTQLPGSNNIEVTWDAPTGWAQGFIDSYQVLRNGAPVGVTIEPDFAATGDFPYPGRSFIDNSVPVGAALGYSVVARTIRDGSVVEGQATSLAVITPIDSSTVGVTFNEGTENESQGVATSPVSSQQVVPQQFVDAVALALDISGADAERLGSQLYVIYTLRDDLTVEFRDLLRVFNTELANFDRRDLSISDQEFAASTSAEIADLLLRRLTAPLQGTNIGVQIEGYGLAPVQNWLRSGGESADQLSTLIAESLELLQATQAAIDALPAGNKPSSNALKNVETPALRIGRALLNGTRTDPTNVRMMYRDITTGYRRTVGVRVDDGDIGSQIRYQDAPSTPFSTLFNASSEIERAQAYGIEPGQWEVAKPFLQIHYDTYQYRKANHGWGKIRSRLTSLVKIGFTLVLATTFGPGVAGALGLKGATAAVVGGAIGGTASTLFATGGDWEAAFKGGLIGAAAAGLKHLASLKDLTTSQKVMKALLESSVAGGSGSFEDRLLAAFANNFVDGMGAKIAKMADTSLFTGELLETILASAVASGGDWDKITRAAETYVLNAIGGEVADFTTDVLGDQWNDLGKTLTGFASYAAASNGDESQAKDFFFRHVMPQMEWGAGGKFTEWYGSKDEIYTGIGKAILVIVNQTLATGGTMEALEKSVESYVYGLAGDFASNKLVAAFTTDGKTPSVVTQFASLLDTYISNGYDPNVQRNALTREGSRIAANALSEVLPNCNSVSVEFTNERLINNLISARNADEFETELENTLTDILSPNSAYHDCAGPEDEDQLSFVDSECPVELSTTELSGVGAGFPGSSRRVAGSATRRFQIERIDPDSSGEVCQTPELFRLALLNLTPAQVIDQVSVFEQTLQAGTEPVELVTFSSDFVDYRLVVAGGANFGQVEELQESGVWYKTGIQISLARDEEGSIERFGDSTKSADGRADPGDPIENLQGFMNWLRSLSSSDNDLNDRFDVSTDRIIARPPKNVDVFSPKVVFQDFRIVTSQTGDRTIGTIQQRQPGSSTWYSPSGGRMTIFWSGDKITGFGTPTFGGNSIGEVLATIPTDQISNQITETTENGVAVITVDQFPNQRIHVADGFGLVHAWGSWGNQWYPTENFVKVNYDAAGVIIGFTHLGANTASVNADLFGLFLSSTIRTWTLNDSWGELGQRLRGCGVAIKQAWDEIIGILGDLPQAVADLVAGLKQMQAQIAASPEGFFNNIIASVLDADQLEQFKQEYGDAAGVARWSGRVMCSIILAIVFEVAIGVVGVVVAKAIMKKVSSGDATPSDPVDLVEDGEDLAIGVDDVCDDCIEEDGGYAETLEPGSSIYARIEDGEFIFNITSRTPGNGRLLFNRAFDALNNISGPIRAVIGEWGSGSNLTSFNAALRAGITPEDAARTTFTGQVAGERGFDRAEIVASAPSGSPGDYDHVRVRFFQGEASESASDADPGTVPTKSFSRLRATRDDAVDLTVGFKDAAWKLGIDHPELTAEIEQFEAAVDNFVLEVDALTDTELIPPVQQRGDVLLANGQEITARYLAITDPDAAPDAGDADVDDAEVSPGLAVSPAARLAELERQAVDFIDSAQSLFDRISNNASTGGPGAAPALLVQADEFQAAAAAFQIDVAQLANTPTNIAELDRLAGVSDELLKTQDQLLEDSSELADGAGNGASTAATRYEDLTDNGSGIVASKNLQGIVELNFLPGNKPAAEYYKEALTALAPVEGIQVVWTKGGAGELDTFNSELKSGNSYEEAVAATEAARLAAENGFEHSHIVFLDGENVGEHNTAIIVFDRNPAEPYVDAADQVTPGQAALALRLEQLNTDFVGLEQLDLFITDLIETKDTSDFEQLVNEVEAFQSEVARFVAEYGVTNPSDITTIDRFSATIEDLRTRGRALLLQLGYLELDPDASEFGVQLDLGPEMPDNVVATVSIDGELEVTDGKGSDLAASIDDGELVFGMLAAGDVTGRQLFQIAFDWANEWNGPVLTILGDWGPDLPSNLNSFNAAIEAGMSQELAALATATGRLASNNGYGVVEILTTDPAGGPGPYTEVSVRYSRGRMDVSDAESMSVPLFARLRSMKETVEELSTGLQTRLATKNIDQSSTLADEVEQFAVSANSYINVAAPADDAGALTNLVDRGKALVDEAERLGTQIDELADSGVGPDKTAENTDTVEPTGSPDSDDILCDPAGCVDGNGQFVAQLENKSKISGRVGDSGLIKFDVTSVKKGDGGRLFEAMLAGLRSSSGPINGIKGVWGLTSTNTEVFNSSVLAGSDLNEAALSTPTGKWAARAGFGRAEVDLESLEGARGSYTGVDVYFWPDGYQVDRTDSGGSENSDNSEAGTNESDGVRYEADNEDGAGASGWKDRNGYVHLTIEAVERSGTEYFEEALTALAPVNGVRATWTMRMPANLDTFNAELRQGKTHEEAAAATFTGKLSARNGFTEVHIVDVEGEPGAYRRAELAFDRTPAEAPFTPRLRESQADLPASAEIARLRQYAGQLTDLDAEIVRQLILTDDTPSVNLAKRVDQFQLEVWTYRYSVLDIDDPESVDIDVLESEGEQLLSAGEGLLQEVNYRRRTAADRADSGDTDGATTGEPDCNSFPTGTLVRMADGSLRPIEHVAAGDRVLAGDPTTGLFADEVVLAQWSHVDDGVMGTVGLTDGSQVSATDHHLFWVASDGSWVELEDVLPGDYLLTPAGVAKVASVAMSNPAPTLVWELDTSGPDTFTVHTGTRDVLVHNAPCNIDDFMKENTATNLEINDGQGSYVTGKIDAGILTIGMRANGRFTGTELFARLMEWAGDVTAIRGLWGSTLPTNLETFKAGIRAGLTPEQAAASTFTGQMALDYGYGDIRNVSPLPSSRSFEEALSVRVLFYRGEFDDTPENTAAVNDLSHLRSSASKLDLVAQELATLVGQKDLAGDPALITKINQFVATAKTFVVDIDSLTELDQVAVIGQRADDLLDSGRDLLVEAQQLSDRNDTNAGGAQEPLESSEASTGEVVATIGPLGRELDPLSHMPPGATVYRGGVNLTARPVDLEPGRFVVGGAVDSNGSLLNRLGQPLDAIGFADLASEMFRAGFRSGSDLELPNPGFGNERALEDRVKAALAELGVTPGNVVFRDQPGNQSQSGPAAVLDDPLATNSATNGTESPTENLSISPWAEADELSNHSGEAISEIVEILRRVYGPRDNWPEEFDELSQAFWMWHDAYHEDLEVLAQHEPSQPLPNDIAELVETGREIRENVEDYLLELRSNTSASLPPPAARFKAVAIPPQGDIQGRGINVTNKPDLTSTAMEIFVLVVDVENGNYVSELGTGSAPLSVGELASRLLNAGLRLDMDILISSGGGPDAELLSELRRRGFDGDLVPSFVTGRAVDAAAEILAVQTRIAELDSLLRSKNLFSNRAFATNRQLIVDEIAELAGEVREVSERTPDELVALSARVKDVDTQIDQIIIEIGHHVPVEIVSQPLVPFVPIAGRGLNLTAKRARISDDPNVFVVVVASSSDAGLFFKAQPDGPDVVLTADELADEIRAAGFQPTMNLEVFTDIVDEAIVAELQFQMALDGDQLSVQTINVGEQQIGDLAANDGQPGPLGTVEGVQPLGTGSVVGGRGLNLGSTTLSTRNQSNYFVFGADLTPTGAYANFGGQTLTALQVANAIIDARFDQGMILEIPRPLGPTAVQYVFDIADALGDAGVEPGQIVQRDGTLPFSPQPGQNAANDSDPTAVVVDDDGTDTPTTPEPPDGDTASNSTGSFTYEDGLVLARQATDLGSQLEQLLQNVGAISFSMLRRQTDEYRVETAGYLSKLRAYPTSKDPDLGSASSSDTVDGLEIEAEGRRLVERGQQIIDDYLRATDNEPTAAGLALSTFEPEFVVAGGEVPGRGLNLTSRLGITSAEPNTFVLMVDAGVDGSFVESVAGGQLRALPTAELLRRLVAAGYVRGMELRLEGRALAFESDTEAALRFLGVGLLEAGLDASDLDFVDIDRQAVDGFGIVGIDGPETEDGLRNEGPGNGPTPTELYPKLAAANDRNRSVMLEFKTILDDKNLWAAESWLAAYEQLALRVDNFYLDWQDLAGAKPAGLVDAEAFVDQTNRAEAELLNVSVELDQDGQKILEALRQLPVNTIVVQELTPSERIFGRGLNLTTVDYQTTADPNTFVLVIDRDSAGNFVKTDWTGTPTILSVDQVVGYLHAVGFRSGMRLEVVGQANTDVAALRGALALRAYRPIEIAVIALD